MPKPSDFHALPGMTGNCKPCCQIFLLPEPGLGLGVLHTASQAAAASWSELAHEMKSVYHFCTWYLGSFLPFHSIPSLSLMMFFFLSSPSSDEFLRPIPSLLLFSLYTFYFFTREFTELRSVTVIPKSAFPAKSQIKSEFQVQISNCVQFHVVILPLLSIDCVWNWTHYLSSPNSLSFFP